MLIEKYKYLVTLTHITNMKKVNNDELLKFVRNFYENYGRLPKVRELNHRAVFFRRFHSISKVAEILNIKVNFVPQTKKGSGPRVKLKLPDVNNIKFARFIGLYAADGSSYYDSYSKKYVIQLDFNRSEQNLIENTKQLCLNLFKKEPFEMKKKDNVIRLTYNSKELFLRIRDLLVFENDKSLTVYLKTINFSNDWLMAFLGGLLDGDGLIRYKDGYETRFVSASPRMKNQICLFLSNLEFLPKEYECYSKKSKWFHISVYGKRIILFLAKAGSVKAKNALLIKLESLKDGYPS